MNSALIAAEDQSKNTNLPQKRACRTHLLSPRIVSIFYLGCACAVNDLDNIALRVAQIVVFRAVEVYGYRAAGRVVAEQQLIRPSLHTNQDGPVVEIIRVNIIDRLLLPQTVLVVFKRQRIRSVACACELLAAPTEGIPAIGRRVAHAVVADRIVSVFLQLIGPSCAVIGITDRIYRCQRRQQVRIYRRVRIDLFVLNVSVLVVALAELQKKKSDNNTAFSTEEVIKWN